MIEITNCMRACLKKIELAKIEKKSQLTQQLLCLTVGVLTTRLNETPTMIKIEI